MTDPTFAPYLSRWHLTPDGMSADIDLAVAQSALSELET